MSVCICICFCMCICVCNCLSIHPPPSCLCIIAATGTGWLLSLSGEYVLYVACNIDVLVSASDDSYSPVGAQSYSTYNECVFSPLTYLQYAVSFPLMSGC